MDYYNSLVYDTYQDKLMELGIKAIDIVGSKSQDIPNELFHYTNLDSFIKIVQLSYFYYGLNFNF